jgi:LPS-assembly protein
MRRIALSVILTILATAAAAQERPKLRIIQGPKPGGGDVRITVKEGTSEAQKDEYVIFQGGEVLVEYQDIKMRSNKLTFNQKTRDVVAEGNVIIDQGPTRISATQAIYNLDSKTGTFFNATATMDPSMYFSGDRIEKIDLDTYRLTNGIFTSCDLDRPAWSFQVGSADVTIDDYAHMRNISFRAGNLPVFYAPRLVWPTKRERSQGLLIPRVRFTNKYGVRLENGYFLPLGDSADATMFADISSERYIGAGVEMRYVPSENVKIGDLRAQVVQDPEENRMEWKYHYRHAQENLPGGFRGVVDVQDFSNIDFFRQYDQHDSTVLTASNIYSSAYLTKNSPKYSLNVLADRRDIALLVPNAENTRLVENRQRFEQLPSLQLRMYPQRIGPTPLYFSMEASTSHLRTSAIADGELDVNADYGRVDAFPTLSMQVRTPQWFSIKPQVAVRQTYYTASLRTECERENPPDACSVCDTFPFSPICTRRTVSDDQSTSRFYAQGLIDTIGPSLSKVFNKPVGGFSRFKHIIEPRVRYVYTTDVDNQNEIIRFDTVDSPFLPIVSETIEYSLTQRLIGKEAGANGNAREVLSFALRQTMAPGDPFRKATTANEDDVRFSPLFASLRFNPYQSTTLDATAAFGNETKQLDQASVSANLIGTGRFADKYLGFTWFASFDDPRTPTDTSSSQIRINTGSYIVKDRIRADMQLNYDATRGRFLEQRYVAGWTGSCYGIALEYRRYFVFGAAVDEELDYSWGIAVSLKNVGTFGSN